MQVLDEVIYQIKRHPHSSSSKILAQAALSACSEAFPGPPLIRVAAVLDRESYRLYCHLAWIVYETDFNNRDQAQAMNILKAYAGVEAA